MSDKNIQIYEKYWSFGQKIKSEPTIVEGKFLFWKYSYKIQNTIYLYKDIDHLINEVNKFIFENKIRDVVSYKNNASFLTIVDYGTETTERIGGINLVYTKEC